MERVKEKDLLMPTLMVIKENPKINMSGLIEKLTDIINPQGIDALL
jgi:hypothetical protein